MKRTLLLSALLILLLLALPANWLLARRAAPPPWPDDIVAHHEERAANLDLAQLDGRSSDEIAQLMEAAWEDGVHILRLRVPWDYIQPQPDVGQWQTFDDVMEANWYDFLTIFVLDGV